MKEINENDTDLEANEIDDKISYNDMSISDLSDELIYLSNLYNDGQSLGLKQTMSIVYDNLCKVKSLLDEQNQIN